MDYYEIKISCPAGQTEEVENLLIINGINDYFVSDPMLEAQILSEMNWLIKDELSEGDAEITVCTETLDEAQNVAKIFGESYKVEIRGANDGEWKDNWKQQLARKELNSTNVWKFAKASVSQASAQNG